MESTEELGFRPCVGVMILNKDGLVWVGRRIDQNKGELQGAGNWWQMPQGGIDEGEPALDAAYRELYEETGIARAHVELLKPASQTFTYKLPDHLIGRVWGGKYKGQTQQWFALRFTGEDHHIDINARNGIKAEFDAWRWVSIDELMDLVIPFKQDVYRSVIAEFQEFAS